MIHLQDKDLIASSKTRVSYIHPHDPDRIIKIVRKKKIVHRDANWKEWSYYQYLKKRYSQLDFISNYHGFVETNLGRGLMIDCVRDYNGRISLRLIDVLRKQDKYDMAEVVMAIEGLCREIVDRNIHLFDLNMLNILIQILPDGRYKAISVDIKGRYNNYELIPISSYIPFFTRIKSKRRCKRLIQRVNQLVRENINHTKK